jgi:ribonucleoside-diphosphate reductase alpha chain
VVVGHAAHFLDNVLDANRYPIDAVRAVTLGNRKIGLGIMGFADLLVSLNLPYASQAALNIANELMAFVQREAKAASVRLGQIRGSFPTFAGSRIAASGVAAMRNACVTSIAPTGTISLLADCSSGIEPFFALTYTRHVIGATRTIDVHPALSAALATSDGAGRSPLLNTVRVTGHLGDAAPSELRALFATAHEIAPEWHVKIQAAFQRHTDTAVSKTINMANEATPRDIASAYRLAFDTGCKGITVFRDGCKSKQVLRAGIDSERCPECGEPMVVQAGCTSCSSCGYSVCMI